MLALIQRVTQAKVEVDAKAIAEIGPGLLTLVGIEQKDNVKTAEKLLEKILNYRVFSDSAGKMNLSLRQISGGLLLVPQFTLVADTSSGLRPSFSAAAKPKIAAGLFTQLVELAQQRHPNFAAGKFGADMAVTLCNSGPVTFLLSS